MNIDQYREMKAQEEQENSQTKEQSNVQTEPSTDGGNAEEQTQTAETQGTSQDDATTQPNDTQQQPPQEDVTQNTPQTIEIDGQQIPIEELKNGYLRQSDYTKKTQELANQRKQTEEAIKFYDQIRQNPQLAQQLSQQTGVESLDPATAKIQELEAKMYDMMVEREIESLQNKYDDFEVREVLQVAHDKNISDLEDAYRIVKASKQPNTQQQEQPDVETLKQQIRQELLQEIESEKGATQSIISSNDSGAPKSTDEPQVSQSEMKVAQMMGLSPKEYAKWRDAK